MAIKFQKEPMNAHSSIKHVIGVVSGKGGVGKSFVTASMAAAMRKKGYEVGIMDADITGPSIPKMYGIHGKAVGDGKEILPAVAEDGTRIMSVNLLVDTEETPVVWRGPVVAGVVKQFWSDVVWGDIDYLFVDMPPGTGDVPLTVFQSLPIEGIVIVENYSYLKCPDCGKEISLFGESHIDEIAADLDLSVLGKLPLDPAYAKAADAGQFYTMDNPYIAKAIEALEQI